MYSKIRLSQLYANEHIERFSFMMFTALACALIVELFLYGTTMQAFTPNTGGGTGAVAVADEFNKILIDGLYKGFKYAFGLISLVMIAFCVLRFEFWKAGGALASAIIYLEAETIVKALGSTLI